jgi:hypothetical protein
VKGAAVGQMLISLSVILHKLIRISHHVDITQYDRLLMWAIEEHIRFSISFRRIDMR